MKLKEWLDKNCIGPKEFARKIKASRASVHNWTSGKYKPNQFYRELIRAETYSQVSLLDWRD